MFTITITETRDVKKIVGKEWECIGTKEVPRDAAFHQGHKDEPKTRIEDVRGYTPEIEKTVSETRQILQQTVEILDVPSVIKAINKIE